jgi:hypothetical protein
MRVSRCAMMNRLDGIGNNFTTSAKWFGSLTQGQMFDGISENGSTLVPVPGTGYMRNKYDISEDHWQRNSILEKRARRDHNLDSNCDVTTLYWSLEFDHADYEFKQQFFVVKS